MIDRYTDIEFYHQIHKLRSIDQHNRGAMQVLSILSGPGGELRCGNKQSLCRLLSLQGSGALMNIRRLDSSLCPIFKECRQRSENAYLEFKFFQILILLGAGEKGHSQDG